MWVVLKFFPVLVFSWVFFPPHLAVVPCCEEVCVFILGKLVGFAGIQHLQQLFPAWCILPSFCTKKNCSEGSGRAQRLWDREGAQSEARKQENKTRSCRSDGSMVLVHPLLHQGVLPVDFCHRGGDLSAEMGPGVVLGREEAVESAALLAGAFCGSHSDSCRSAEGMTSQQGHPADCRLGWHAWLMPRSYFSRSCRGWSLGRTCGF